MGAGWLLCMSIASLPLFGVSDYRTFAICLPFETTETVSLGMYYKNQKRSMREASREVHPSVFVWNSLYS